MTNMRAALYLSAAFCFFATTEAVGHDAEWRPIMSASEYLNTDAAAVLQEEEVADAGASSYRPPLLLEAQYRAVQRWTAYTLDREDVDTVDDLTSSTGSVIFADVRGLSAFAASSSELFAEDDFYTTFNLPGAESNRLDTPETLDAVDRVFGIGVNIGRLLALDTLAGIRTPTLGYSRRQVRGAFTSERRVVDGDDALVAEAGQPFTLTDEAEIFSLQWGRDPRFTGSGTYIKYWLDLEYHYFVSLDYTRYESEVFDNIDRDTAQITLNESDSYGVRLGGRVQPTERFHYPSFGIEGAIAAGDRSQYRLGVYGGYYIQTRPDCSRVNCLSLSLTIGGFVDSTDFSGEEGDRETSNGRRISEFETVSTTSAIEATAGLSYRF